MQTTWILFLTDFEKQEWKWESWMPFVFSTFHWKQVEETLLGSSVYGELEANKIIVNLKNHWHENLKLKTFYLEIENW